MIAMRRMYPTCTSEPRFVSLETAPIVGFPGVSSLDFIYLHSIVTNMLLIMKVMTMAPKHH